MLSKALLLNTALAVSSFAAPMELVERQSSCPKVHIFGARETTAPAGYGSAGTFVNLILNAYPGSTAEAINYPAAGNTNAAYASSVQAGVQAVYNQVSAFAAKCPNTALVLVGYSQGAEIEDDALCGGGDPNQGVTNTAATIANFNIKAVIWAGDPRFTPGESFHVGSATAGGFDQRPSSQTSCGKFNSLIQSYCDASDPYCSNGNNAATHQGYGSEYGQAALNFVKSKIPVS
ncbi:carbohydrate esterase family 5 protein [Baudoinia panamericana UAMH 10762]|uniref:Carbohydrate esterase family 5 protein n=1 Tax=Baudoinia panamericana (strain UAMH 10762) TaxID=717646 RepID=M2MY42_BAUPA|nr:carbohydrate esterase family 5 protein [Baudoinia panamericana UAMH 10762]EMC96483.1 carbohydrate esterase family 5 protein [Baudoinia panamericana UAMH 10762]